MGPDFGSEQLEGDATIGKAGDKKAGNVCKQLSPGEKTQSTGSSGLLSPAWLCD